jgi:hypothetical protein
MRIITLVLLLTACAQAPVYLVDKSVDPECSMVFGGTGMQFLGCESGPYVNQTQ